MPGDVDAEETLQLRGEGVHGCPAGVSAHEDGGEEPGEAAEADHVEAELPEADHHAEGGHHL